MEGKVATAAEATEALVCAEAERGDGSSGRDYRGGGSEEQY